jgi:TRAP-type C4-dicarboxylate transport system permease small subunit
VSQTGDPPPPSDSPPDALYPPVAAGTEAALEPAPGPGPGAVVAPLPTAVVHAGHLVPVDEPSMARSIRRFDDALGSAERGLLFAAFAVLVLTNLYRTFLSIFMHESSLKAIEVSRISAFAIGIFGAAYAAQSRRNFGLDLVSALMSARVKAVTRVFTNLAALAAAGLLFYGGRLIQDALTKEKQHYEVVPLTVVGWFIPVCALLIGIHVLLHLVIEVEYLRRGRTAPEPELVG